MVSKYTCVQPIEHDQQRFDIGSEISLPDDAAKLLLSIGHIAAAAKKGKPSAAEKEAAEKEAAERAEAERIAAEEAARAAAGGS